MCTKFIVFFLFHVIFCSSFLPNMSEIFNKTAKDINLTDISKIITNQERNNNSFDVVVDIDFIEENEKNINMNYKLRSKGKYLFGNATDYAKFNNFRLEKVTIPAKSQIPYILDWKWVDSDNDTIIGFDYGSNYKLSIKIGVNN